MEEIIKTDTNKLYTTPRFWVPHQLWKALRKYLKANDSDLRTFIHSNINKYDMMLGNGVPTLNDRNEFLKFAFSPNIYKTDIDNFMVWIDQLDYNLLTQLAHKFSTSSSIMLTNIVLQQINSLWDELIIFNTDFSKADFNTWIDKIGNTNQRSMYLEQFVVCITAKEHTVLTSKFPIMTSDCRYIESGRIRLKSLVKASIEYFNSLQFIPVYEDEPSFKISLRNYSIISPRTTDEILDVGLENKININRIVRLYINHLMRYE